MSGSPERAQKLASEVQEAKKLGPNKCGAREGVIEWINTMI